MFKKRAKQYFLLGDQYSEAANLLLEFLINNGNSNGGIGSTEEEEAYQQMIENASKSDMYLFVPAIFNILQSTELFAKGLLLLNNIEIDETHDIEKLLKKLQNKYDNKPEIYTAFYNIYFSQQNILKEYRNKNGITNTNDLYASLRYPESKKGKQYEYFYLMYNGDNGIKLFKKLQASIANIKKLVLNEYHYLCNNGAE